MKKILLMLVLMAATVQLSFAAINFVDPATDTLDIDEGFNVPYVTEITTQEGDLFTTAQMEAFTKFRLYFGTEYTESATCFDWATYKTSSKIIIKIASINWTDGSGEGTLFGYSPTWPSGLRIGTFNMISSGSLSSSGLAPEAGIYLDDLTDVSTTGATVGQFLKKTGASTYAFADAITTIAGNESAFTGWDKDASNDFDGTYSALSGIPSTFAPASHDNTAHSVAYLSTETDPDFALWLSTFSPYTDSDIDGNESAFTGWDKNASDDFTWDYDFGDLINVPAYLMAETDPDFAAWLLATPPLYSEVDGSATNEIEVVDEAFNATNFDGGTASAVSQDDFYDLWHSIDTNDDGTIDTLPASLRTDSITANFDGIAIVKTGAVRWYPPAASTLVSCTAFAATAPTGAALAIDVNKNGVTVLASVLSIADGDTSSAVTVPTTTAMLATDYLTWDIDQIGSTEPGRDITLRIVYTMP